MAAAVIVFLIIDFRVLQKHVNLKELNLFIL